MHRLVLPTFYFVISLLIGCSDETPQTPSIQSSNSGSIDRNGAILQYVREGNGTPAVVIGSSVLYPRFYSASLRKHLDLIFVDGRHFAPSYSPSESELAALTMETWADDVEALRESLGIDQWLVIGHSIQAQIALAYAHKYPRAIKGLVLIAGVPYAGGDVDQALEEIWDSQATESRKTQHAINVQGLEEKLAATPEDRQFVVYYIANAALYWANPTYDSTPLWEGVRTSTALDQLVESRPGRAVVREIIEDIATPTLVVVGKHDYAVPYTIWESLVENNPAVSYVLMDQDSHNPQAEGPNRFDPILLNWLEH